MYVYSLCSIRFLRLCDLLKEYLFCPILKIFDCKILVLDIVYKNLFPRPNSVVDFFVLSAGDVFVLTANDYVEPMWRKEVIPQEFEPPRAKTNNVVFEQVRHKPSCTSTEKNWDISRREIVLSV